MATFSIYSIGADGTEVVTEVDGATCDLIRKIEDGDVWIPFIASIEVSVDGGERHPIDIEKMDCEDTYSFLKI